MIWPIGKKKQAADIADNIRRFLYKREVACIPCIVRLDEEQAWGVEVPDELVEQFPGVCDIATGS